MIILYRIMENTININNLIELAKQNNKNYRIILILNVQGMTVDKMDYTETSIMSEYYSREQCNQILKGIRFLGYETLFYYDEDEFIRDIENKKLYNQSPKKNLILNLSQKGIGKGRQALIPAFCDMNNLMHSDSDPTTITLLRNKFLWYQYFKDFSNHIIESWFFRYQGGWLFDKKPPEGTKIIAKLNDEASSIGLTIDNVFTYDGADDFFNKMASTYKSDLIIQRFIEGKELEVPVIKINNKVTVFKPAGISLNSNKNLGNKILDYTIRGDHLFEFYDYYEYNHSLADSIMEETYRLCTQVNINGISRIDYRIDSNDNFYVTDIATKPHISKSMTFYYLYQLAGYDYSDVLATFIGATIMKYE